MLCINFFHTVKLKPLVIFGALLTQFSLYGQLDSIHWLPPVTAGSIASNVGAYEHSVYLSTPNTTAFDVTVTTGSGTVLGTYSISAASPYRLDLANGYNYLCMDADSVGIVQQDYGLTFTAEEQFYVNYRVRSNAQGGSLTAKGRIARGTHFHWGGIPLIGNSNNLNAVVGLMAMEDNTTVTISGYDSNCEFRQGSNASGITSNTITLNLDAGETYVLEAVNLVVPENQDGWLGAIIDSDNDIVVNNGNLMGGVIAGSSARDICFDQTLPTSRLGNNHIVLRGDGIDATELVIVIATQNGTDVSINGAAPSVTLNEGEYHIFDGTHYSAQNNMYVQTSQPAYVYQVLAGSVNERTIGLNFIPPLNCLLPLAVDNIAAIDMIRNTSYSGGVTILTRTGATVSINGSAPSASPQAVLGTSDWVTYRETGLSGNVAIVSNEPMAAGMFGASGDAGFAGYFSGFSERPNPEIVRDHNCVPTTLTLINTADNMQWYFDNAMVAGEVNQTMTANNEGSYFVTAGTGTCMDTSNTIVFSCNSLPVEYGGGLYRCENGNASIEWTTITEMNNDYFTIEGTFDGIEFYELGELKGAGTTTHFTEYHFDLKENSSYPLFRISQTDFDGRHQILETLSSWECNQQDLWYVSDNLIQFRGDYKTDVMLFDATGKMQFSGSAQQIPWKEKGILFIQFKDSSENWKKQRLVVY
ncbi:MAG: IgGFc-binding protein [Fluviicola sp.]